MTRIMRKYRGRNTFASHQRGLHRAVGEGTGKTTAGSRGDGSRASCATTRCRSRTSTRAARRLRDGRRPAGAAEARSPRKRKEGEGPFESEVTCAAWAGSQHRHAREFATAADSRVRGRTVTLDARRYPARPRWRGVATRSQARHRHRPANNAWLEDKGKARRAALKWSLAPALAANLRS